MTVGAISPPIFRRSARRRLSSVGCGALAWKRQLPDELEPSRRAAKTPGDGPWPGDRLAACGDLSAILATAETAAAQAAAAAELERLRAADEQAVAALLGSDAASALLSRMAALPHAVAFQATGCTFLLVAASHGRRCQRLVGALGGVQAALRAASAHAGEARVLEPALRALREMAAYSASNQAEILSGSGVQLVLGAMQDHSASPIIQVVGCGVLRNLTATSAEHQQRVFRLGGAEVVSVSMRGHPGSPDVQQAGCWALFCMCVRNAELQRALASAGAVDLALDALGQHPRHASVQEAGCWLVRELAAQIASDSSWRLVLGMGAVRRAMASSTPAVHTAAAGAARALATRAGFEPATPRGGLRRQQLAATLHVISE
eukprot:CAMPEP_0176004882 /NCGR_PEP_ID=MMETSP0120_2-20121206/1922_1 /TAXON_ID=160619 /ORGANISM="Kryptoperidinium foliaceum, Strain CCMP 1326" /LENGTH=376 /DNA_ID=CAMNT_0017337577 /DNA_START=1 /DNA_END=1131 /DNA_ORIENTATION=-